MTLEPNYKLHYYGIAQGLHKGRWSKCKLEPCISETKAIALEIQGRINK